MDHPEELSLSAFNAHMGYRGRYAYELHKADRLVMTDDGKRVRVVESIRRIEETRDPSRASTTARHAATRGTTMPPLDEPPQGEPAGEGAGKFQDSRAKREHFAALREENGYYKDAGRLMDADEALGAFADAGARVAAVLDAVPATVGPMLVGLTAEDQIRVLGEQMDIARAELAAAVEELAKQIDQRRAQGAAA